MRRFMRLNCLRHEGLFQGSIQCEETVIGEACTILVGIGKCDAVLPVRELIPSIPGHLKKDRLDPR